MNAQLLCNACVGFAHVSLVAVGFGLVYRTVRIFHFAYAGVYVAGAYAAYGVSSASASGTVLGLVVGTLFGIAVGASTEVLVYRPMRRRGATAVGNLVASLGMLIVIQHAISLIVGDDAKRIQSASALADGFNVFSGRLTGADIGLVASAALALLALCVFFATTTAGLSLKAVASEPDLARARGVDVERSILQSFLVSSALGSIAGTLWASSTALTPGMGLPALLSGMVAAIVGGVGSLPGAVVGAMMVVFLQNLAVWFFAAEWQDAVVFLFLLGLLAVKPGGLLGDSEGGPGM